MANSTVRKTPTRIAPVGKQETKPYYDKTTTLPEGSTLVSFGSLPPTATTTISDANLQLSDFSLMDEDCL